MDPHRNFFASSGQYAWPAQNSFEYIHQQNIPNIGAPNSGPQATATIFTSAPGSEPGHASTARPSQANEPKGSRSRNRGLRWDLHRTELQELYLVQKKTLDEVRQWMSRERSFTATPKQYKDQFRAWNWQKNLPVETAQFMVSKANERKRGPQSKDTTFEFGGMSWTRERAEATIKRARKQLPEINNMPTPNGVIYETPTNVDATSPETALTPYDKSGNDEIMTISSSSDEWESEPENDPNPLPLMWNGKTRSDVHALFLNAQNCARNGDSEAAEAMFRSAVTGYKYLLGPAHEETNKVVYILATFYYGQDRLPEAYKIIEHSCRDHVETLGIQHRRTQQHITNVVELLHGWNKGDDALAFLARAKELAESINSRTNTIRRQRPNRLPAVTRKPTSAPDSLLLEAARSISDNPQDATQLDYGLSVARAHSSVNGEAVEQLLLTTINQCGQDADRLAVQRLKAWAELLKLPRTMAEENASFESFESAHAAFTDVMRRFPWHVPTRRKFESFQLIEVALELIAPFVKANYLDDAKGMFQVCEEKATANFGDEDERTIWMFISIGLIYQRYKGWDEAKHWFEQALAAAMEKYDEDDGIRISLEEAMEVRHFSYVNDEGRPYKTIFGVGGLKIMPIRLHME
ncbi:hypothetical protein N0V83_008176 [Neocucurbitaria cava]|uniref:Clr5 domain-containing protein n=1 Tax=Neocucurbitaria cava TaxID=798079 RepID=A0A9W9CJE6_9PLEO|nr:hypothetical protein N0V83_008176 [Neocucurbitaria cava]